MPSAHQGEERQAVDKHLGECCACRLELYKLQGDLALLAFSASGPQPPARSRNRLMAAVAREPHPQLGQRARMSWWNALGWAAAVAALVIGALLEHQNSERRQRLADLDNSFHNKTSSCGRGSNFSQH